MEACLGVIEAWLGAINTAETRVVFPGQAQDQQQWQRAWQVATSSCVDRARHTALCTSSRLYKRRERKRVRVVG